MAQTKRRLRSSTVVLGGMGVVAAALTSCGSEPDRRCVDRDSYTWDGYKVIADKKTHELLGVHIVGPEASDLISEGALALEMHAFLEDIGLTIHPHPTLGEGMMEASLHGLGQAVHILNK